ncbi:MAG: DDE-type integrase/transposase/recombinase, partial [Fibrobacterales bacterium]
MIDTSHKLSVLKQCKLLEVNRSSVYRPQYEWSVDKSLVDEIDVIYTLHPFFGARGIKKHLFRKKGLRVTRYIVAKIMKLLGVQSIAPKPQQSKINKEHKIYPYLLKKMPVINPGQVWTSDITYIRVQGGFLYLTAVMDWATRKILSWRLSNTMDTSFCVETLNEALLFYPHPEVFNTDQG